MRQMRGVVGASLDLEYKILYVYYYVSADESVLRRSFVNKTKPAGGRFKWIDEFEHLANSKM